MNSSQPTNVVCNGYFVSAASTEPCHVIIVRTSEWNDIPCLFPWDLIDFQIPATAQCIEDIWGKSPVSSRGRASKSEGTKDQFLSLLHFWRLVPVKSHSQRLQVSSRRVFAMFANYIECLILSCSTMYEMLGACTPRSRSITCNIKPLQFLDKGWLPLQERYFHPSVLLLR